MGGNEHELHLVNGRTNSGRRTVLVTGASSGLGEAFAKVFAKNGFDVVLSARRKEQLAKVAAAIEARYDVTAHCVDVDLADPAGPQHLYDELARRQIHIDALVNNAGLAIPGFYHDTSWSEHRDFLQLMVTAPSQLAYLFESAMVKHGYGRIINVASFAGLVTPTGSYTLYSAAKSFLIKFSQAHSGELEGTGVKVLALCPGFFKSSLHDENDDRIITNNLPSKMFLNVDTVAKEGFEAVMNGEEVVVVNGRIYKLILHHLENLGFSKIRGKGKLMSYADRLRSKLDRASRERNSSNR